MNDCASQNSRIGDKPILPRSINSTQLFSIAFGCIIGYGCFFLPGGLFLGKASFLDISIGVLLGVVLMLIIEKNYSYMMSRKPHAGGEFTYIHDEMKSTSHSFIVGWLLLFAYISLSFFNATGLGVVLGQLLPKIFHILPMYELFGNQVYLPEVLVSSIVMLVFCLLNLRGAQLSGKAQMIIAFSLALIGTGVFVFSLFQPGALAKIQAGITEPNNSLSAPGALFSWRGIAAVLAIAPFLFVGFDTLPQMASEAISPQKLSRLAVIALLFGAFLYIAMNVVSLAALGDQIARGSMDWQSFGWVLGAAVESTLGKVGLILLSLALLSAMCSGINGFLLGGSRLMYGMSLRGGLGKQFQTLGHTGVPKTAILWIMPLAIVAPFLGRPLLGKVIDLSSLGAAVAYAYTCLAVFKMLQNDDKATLKAKTFAVLGCALSIVFLLLLILPSSPGYIGSAGMMVLLAWAGLGALYFHVGGARKRLIASSPILANATHG